MPRRSSKERMLRQTMSGIEPVEPARSWPLRVIQRGMGARTKQELASARPSASILLISSENRILLLQRVNNSASFASAHVFPGGHVDSQDGDLPPTSNAKCHEDSLPYRLAAIRECFEESGILLARPTANLSTLIDLSEQQLDEGRRAVQAQNITFIDWLRKQDTTPDTDGLIPFTRWLTPLSIPKRYTTQMYIYFLPLDSAQSSPGAQKGKQMYIPTPDGGVEHTAARFLYTQEWLDMGARKEIILFPPQFILLSLIAPFLAPAQPGGKGVDIAILQEQRESLKRWVEMDGDPPWVEKCISPDVIKKVKNQYMIMGLDKPGPELEGTSRKGDEERVLKVVVDKGIERGGHRPRPVEILWRKDVFAKDETARM